MDKDVMNQELNLKDILSFSKDWILYFKSKWKIIFIFSVIGGVLGMGYAFYKKPVYKAVLTYAVEDAKTSGNGLGSIASSMGLDIGGSSGGAFASHNLMELFKSRLMIEKALLTKVPKQSFDYSLADMFLSEGKVTADHKIYFKIGEKRTTFTREQDSLLRIVSSKISKSILTVEQLDKSVGIGVVTTSYTNEDFSKYFTDVLTKTVIDYYVDTKTARSKDNLEILEFQTDSIRSELNNSLVGVAVATDQTFGLNPALNIKKVSSTRKQVDVQANSEILKELIKQTQLARVNLRKDTPLIQIIDRPILPLEFEQTSPLFGFIFGFFIIFVFVLSILSILKIKDQL